MRQWGKYLIVLLLTCGIFAISWYVSSYFSGKKIAEIRDIQNKIAVDILSSETQYSLLEELSCSDINSSIISDELLTLADRITYSEQNLSEQDDVLLLKKQYTMLQVKDFLLKKRISERCKTPFTAILYFYGTKQNCADCERQGYVLDAARAKYPELRIYSYDYNLDLSTIRALRSIYKVDEPLPVLVINSKTQSGFKTLEEIEALLPKDFIKRSQAQAQAAAEAKEEKK
ncbi:hypothetical protein IT401_00895 [Candidatus Nomurabacteria bacterium]|nr:hypothetical protein [Candidatus Nomurabacteria bacterium]